jgi:diguanylate cyclase (GGDEF)-like protein
VTIALAMLVAALAVGLVQSRRQISTLRQAVAVATAAARTDPLTGLANRAGLQHAMRQVPGVAHGLILLDLDAFKPINDRYGHGVGDEVLCEIARRITAQVSSGCCVARLGGDEFVVLLSGATVVDEELALCARQICARIADPIGVGDVQLRVTASAGMAVLPAERADRLLSAADEAMYQAKRTIWRLAETASH